MKIKLYTIPYSGSSATLYLKWKPLLHSDIELIPLEFPGRGKRFGASLCGSMPELIEDLYQCLEGQLDDCPYAIYGHSLGGLAAYELSLLLMEKGHRLPAHLFLSACNPPHEKYGRAQLHLLPDGPFLEEIIKLGGTPREAQESAELMKLFVPIIKADYKIYETYVGRDEPVRLPVDFTVLQGKSDPLMSPQKGQEWNRYSGRQFNQKVLDGGHFFIHESQDEVISAIHNALFVYA
jgi:medium-chain acyl-[acyl-carrier-protein] hydrolase